MSVRRNPASAADASAATPAHDPSDVLVLDRAEQLKALGHPLRLRVFETLGAGEALTNRELAQRLGVDPGHLHFHVRFLLRAGLIELAGGGKGREKPYRVVASRIRVASELLSSALSTDIYAAMLDEVRSGWAEWGPKGQFRSAQLTIRLELEQIRGLFHELVEKAAPLENESLDPLVVTLFAHPPPSVDERRE